MLPNVDHYVREIPIALTKNQKYRSLSGSAEQWIQWTWPAVYNIFHINILISC